MRSLLLTALFLILAQARSHSSKDWNVCEKTEYFNQATSTCEPCTQCGDHMYERQQCTYEENTVCGWCGSREVVYNDDFEIKCSRNRKLFYLHLRKKLNLQYEITKNALEKADTDAIVREEMNMLQGNIEESNKMTEDDIIREEIARLKSVKIDEREDDEIVPVKVLERMDGSEEDFDDEEIQDEEFEQLLKDNLYTQMKSKSMKRQLVDPQVNDGEDVNDYDLKKLIEDLEHSHDLLGSDEEEEEAVMEFREIDFDEEQIKNLKKAEVETAYDDKSYVNSVVYYDEEYHTSEESDEATEIEDKPVLVKDELFSAEEMSDEKFEEADEEESEEAIPKAKWIHIVSISERKPEEIPRDEHLEHAKMAVLEREVGIRRFLNVILVVLALVALYCCIRLVNKSRKQVRELQYRIDRLTLLTPEQREMIESSAKSIPAAKKPGHCYENKLAGMV